MVHYWYFFREMNRPTVESVVYYIKVGESSRQQTKFALVREFCKDCGLYFEPISQVSDEAIRQLENSLFSGSNWFARKLRRATISIDELYELIIDDSFVSFEKCLAEKKSYSYFRSMVDPSFFFAQNKLKEIKIPASPVRKYLKYGKGTSVNSFLINSVAVLIVWIITAYFESRGW
jgi:hypothetical protein